MLDRRSSGWYWCLVVACARALCAGRDDDEDGGGGEGPAEGGLVAVLSLRQGRE